LIVRHALLASLALVAGCMSDPTPSPLPTAPDSAITVTTAVMTYTGMAAAEMVATADCPAADGLGPRASTADAAVTALFSTWPNPGVYDLSDPGTSDLVVVGATTGATRYCSNRGASTGYVVVHRFEQVGDRYIVDVELTGVSAGAATVDAHLYH
jgi:hypothetical protein